MGVSVRATPYIWLDLIRVIYLVLISYLKPDVVCCPTKTTKDEQLPLIPTHANILQGSVDHLCLACVVALDQRIQLHEASTQGPVKKILEKHTVISRVIGGSGDVSLDLCTKTFEGQTS